jgi:hypothetical protein
MLLLLLAGRLFDFWGGLWAGDVRLEGEGLLLICGASFYITNTQPTEYQHRVDLGL